MFAANAIRATPPAAGDPPGSPITINSTSAGFSFPENFSPLSRPMTITVQPGGNRRIYAEVFVGHDAWMNSYTGPTITSTLGGTYTAIAGPVFLGSVSGWPQGAMWLLECLSPPVGAQTLTVGISAGQYMRNFMASARCYNNVGSRGTIVTQSQTGTGGALNIALAAPSGGVNLVGFGATDALTLSGASTAADLWFSAGSAQPGDLDYARCMDLAGDGTTKTFTTVQAPKLCAIGVPLIKAA